MRVSTWLWSLLERDYRQAPEAFAARYPGDWLIWEPGDWRPARNATERDKLSTVNLAGAATELRPPRPPGTDTFCFQLQLGDDDEVSVGRGTASDVLINDLTLSRTHLRLRRDSFFVDPTCRRVTRVGDDELPTGVWQPLRDGTSAFTGAVHLPWLGPAGMLRRLATPRIGQTG